MDVRKIGSVSEVLLPGTTITSLINQATDNVVFDVTDLESTVIRMNVHAINSFTEAQLGIEGRFAAGTIGIGYATATEIVARTPATDFVALELRAATDSEMTSAQSGMVRGNNVFRVSARIGTTNLSDLGGPIDVDVPFTESGTPGVWRMVSNGSLEPVPFRHDIANRRVVFTVDRLSLFLVAPSQGGEPQPSSAFLGVQSATALTALQGTQSLHLLSLTIGSRVYESRLGTELVESMLDAPPFIDPVYERTMVPFRVIAEALGADVAWDEATRTVSFILNGDEVSLVIDQPLPEGMGVPVIREDRTFVPVRFVAETLGAYIRWSAENAVVYVYDFDPATIAR